MLTNYSATIKELRVVSEGATVRDWVEIGTEKIFIAPASSQLRGLASDYQIMGEPCEAFVKPSSIIEEGHRLETRAGNYDVKGVNSFFGSGSVDNKQLILEKIKQ
jgi:hypothetical protein